MKDTSIALLKTLLDIDFLILDRIHSFLKVKKEETIS